MDSPRLGDEISTWTTRITKWELRLEQGCCSRKLKDLYTFKATSGLCVCIDM